MFNNNINLVWNPSIKIIVCLLVWMLQTMLFVLIPIIMVQPIAVIVFLIVYVIYIIYQFSCSFFRDLSNAYELDIFIKEFTKRPIEIHLRVKNSRKETHHYAGGGDSNDKEELIISNEANTQITGFITLDKSEFNLKNFTYSEVIPLISLKTYDEYSKRHLEYLKNDFFMKHNKPDQINELLVIPKFSKSNQDRIFVLKDKTKIKTIYTIFTFCFLVELIKYCFLRPKGNVFFYFTKEIFFHNSNLGDAGLPINITNQITQVEINNVENVVDEQQQL
jgi:hypothetical protein